LTGGFLRRGDICLAFAHCAIGAGEGAELKGRVIAAVMREWQLQPREGCEGAIEMR